MKRKVEILKTCTIASPSFLKSSAFSQFCFRFYSQASFAGESVFKVCGPIAFSLHCWLKVMMQNEQPATFTEFVKHLGTQPHDRFLDGENKNKLNVTPFSTSIRKFWQTNIAIDVHLIPDNLKRIKVFKDFMFHELKGITDATLLNPLLKQIGNGGEDKVPTGVDLLKKSELISKCLRDSGNSYYKLKNATHALRCYTLACSYAPKGSKFEALAYSNRSACYFVLHNFARCLEDIHRFEKVYENLNDEIKSTEEFQRVTERLSDRKDRCMKKLNEANLNPGTEPVVDFIKQYFKLKNPSKIIPSAEQFIGIEQDLKRGRYVCNVGQETITPGSVIILEAPYSKILVETYSLMVGNCRVCLKNLEGGGIPCESCVFSLYCSDKCASSPDALLHLQYECKIAHYLYELNMDRLVYLSLVTLLTLGLDGLLSHFRNPKIQLEDQIIGFSDSGVYDSSSYLTINKLIYHDKILSKSEIIKYCTNSVLVTEILNQKTDFFSSIDEAERPNVMNQFASLHLLHQLNFPCNAHALYQPQKLKPSPTTNDILKSSYQEIGSGAFSLLSLINHSCDPNVLRVTLKNGINALITIRHIQKGQEILDNYGYHYATHSMKERQDQLQYYYNFKCECPPCKFGWEGIDQLRKMEDNVYVKGCSVCKLRFTDDFNFNGTELVEKAEGSLVCPVCNTAKSSQNLAQEFGKALSEFYLARDILLEEYDPMRGFLKFTELVEFFDLNCVKPYKCFNLAQEFLKLSLFRLLTHELNTH